jgi:hypothetical protein
MTTRKADIPLRSRLTAYITREQGAAELQISPSTWDEMVEGGLLPRPCLLGPNKDIKRWRWSDVDKAIVGDDGGEEYREPYFRGLARGQTQDH